MKKTIAACVIILLTLPQIISAQYKLSIGNFWITNFESYIEKLEITDTVTLFDSLFYYELGRISLLKNSQIIYKETSDTVNGTFIRKLPNGLFEKVTYKNGERFGFENYYEYKDNPQLHERWLHIIFESDTFWAVAQSIFDGLVFGEIRKVIEVRYSTGLEDYNRYFCDELGAELSETSADGMEVRSYLLGCFVDGIVYGDTSFKPVGIEGPNKLNLKYELEQNYPNPFNPSTTISYQIPNNGFVSLKVYNSLGQEVKTLVNENKGIGNYSVEFNASNLPSGMYFYKLESGKFSQTKKMLLLK